MANPFSGSGLVFIDYSKSRAADLIEYFQFFSKCFDQGCLPSAHLALKNPKLFITSMGNNLTRGILNLVESILNSNQEFLTFGSQVHERHNHFFQRYTSVLKSVFIKVDIIIIVVGIGKEIVLNCEDIGRGNI